MPRKRTKTRVFNFKVSDDTLMEFRVASEMRGLNMSALLHQFMVETIQEQKEKRPDTFARILTRLEREAHEDRLRKTEEKQPDEDTPIGAQFSPIEHPEEIRKLDDLTTKEVKQPQTRKRLAHHR